MEMDPSGVPQVPCFDFDLKELMWAANVCIECPYPAPCQVFCSQGVNIPKVIYRSALMLAQKQQMADGRSAWPMADSHQSPVASPQSSANSHPSSASHGSTHDHSPPNE